MIQNQSTIIALSRLSLSARNVRSGPRTNIESLAHAILTQGVLQSLVVTKNETKGKDFFEVVAGGRRLEALNRLRKQGKIKPSFEVPCTIVASGAAIAASLTENVSREDMHPADEFDAFKRLVDDGKSIEDIAALFGVTPLVVKRRLKLANVSPALIACFRSGEMDDLETLMAFTISEDHALQEQVWASLPEHSRRASYVKAALTEKELPSSDRLVRFVGIKAYQKAGGPVRVDLFSDDNLAYIQDVSLLRSLAQTKLDKKAEQIRDEEGAAWADARLDVDYAERHSYGTVGTIRKEPNAKQSAQLKKLREQLAVLEANESEDAEDATWEQVDDINDRIQAIEQSLERPDARAVKISGLLVEIEDNGRVEVTRGLIRSADKKLLKEIIKAAAVEEGSADLGKPGSDSGLSAALTLNLSANLTAALRDQVGQTPTVAIRALTAALVASVFGSGSRTEQPVKVHGVEPAIGANAPESAEGKAATAFQSRHDAWEKRLCEVGDVFAWLLKQPHPDVLELLAHCAAWALDVIGTKTPKQEANSLARAAGLDMRSYWTATADGFLKRIPKGDIIEALREAEPTIDLARFEKMKKGELVTAAEPILAKAQWLPAMLRLEVSNN